MNDNKVHIHNAAIISVGLAILGFFVFGVLSGLGAVGSGFYAKSQIEKGNGAGIKLALTGIWCGAIVAGITLLYVMSGSGTYVEFSTPVDSWPGLAQHIFDTFFN